MTHERIILDNRSSKPLYESYGYALDFYWQEYDIAYAKQELTYMGFKFIMLKNKDNVTIQIYDNE